MTESRQWARLHERSCSDAVALLHCSVVRTVASSSISNLLLRGTILYNSKLLLLSFRCYLILELRGDVRLVSNVRCVLLRRAHLCLLNTEVLAQPVDDLGANRTRERLFVL